MPTRFEELDWLLNEINQQMLSYFLQDNEDSARKRDAQRLDERKAGLLEDAIGKEFNALFGCIEGLTTIHTPSIYDIIHHAGEAAEVAGDLVLGIAALKRLKEGIIKYEQDLILQKVKSYIFPLQRMLSRTSRSSDAVNAFPGCSGRSNDADTGKTMGAFIEMIGNGSPDDLVVYLDQVGEAVFRDNSPMLGARMLKALQEKAIMWCLSPAAIETDTHTSGVLDERFGSKRHDYAKLMLMLEEMEFRIHNIERRWEDIFVQVFRKDGKDYAEDLAKEEERLERLRAQLGTSELRVKLSNGEINIPNILKQTATLGPRHLSMVRNYVRTYSREIQKGVFDVGAVVDEYVKPDVYRIIIEPREVVSRPASLLLSYGFRQEEVALFGSVANGIKSAYTIIRVPPPRVPSNTALPPDLEGLREGLFIAERIYVLDFYRGISAEYLRSRPDIPRDGLQIKMPYDVLVREDMSVVLERKKMRNEGGRRVPAYHKQSTDKNLGAHQEIAEFKDEHPDSETMTRADFEDRRRRQE